MAFRHVCAIAAAIAPVVLARSDTSAANTLRSQEGVEYARVRDLQGQELVLALDIIQPGGSGAAPQAAVVFVHGGGMTGGSRRDGRWLVEEMARRGFVSVSIDYRLMQQGQFPAALDDSFAAVDFLRSRAEEFGIDADAIGVWGHSAGAHLAALVGVCGNEPTMREGDSGGEPVVSCSVAVSGPHDIDLLMRQMMGLPEGADLPPAMAPMKEMLAQAATMSHVDADDPPLMIIHGPEDTAIPVVHGRRLRDAAIEVEMPHEYIEPAGLGHNDIFTPETVDAIEAFFRKHLGD